MKYHAKKTELDGITFDSKKEANRYAELKLLERSGAIHNLQRQVRYELIPAQKKNGKTVERACHYIADFVYEENGKTVVEDVKGYRTKEYVLKRKLMLQVHGIEVREV
jgi:hypothetical protein